MQIQQIPELDTLITEVEKTRTLDSNGCCTFRGFLEDELEAVLRSYTEFNTDVPDIEVGRIIQSAVFGTGKEGPLTRASIEIAMKRLESEFLARPSRQLVMATSLSIDPRTPLGRVVRIDGCTVSISPQLPTRFEIPRGSPLDVLLSEHKTLRIPQNFLSVRVALRARSPDAAVQRAWEALDLLRGIWNLSVNRVIIARFRSGERSPINAIRPGPVHTVHSPNGDLVAVDGYWYEPLFDRRERSSDLRQKWNVVLREELAVRRMLKRSRYSGDLKIAIRRYARALDSVDYETSFLRLWALLEYLTNTTTPSYDATIKRVLFAQRDRVLGASILEHLRYQRNRVVHSSARGDHYEALIFQLKRYVEELLILHLRRRGEFSSRGTFAQFLDEPRDPATLKEQIARKRKALRYQTVPKRRIPKLVAKRSLRGRTGISM